MDYKEAVQLINNVSWETRAPGLDRMRELLHHLSDPQNDLIFIHVAGTNGKGSTCAMLDSILREAGCKTGLFTSPHLVKYNERIKINGTDISDEDFVRLTERVYEAGRELSESPTVFEILTAIGMLYFAENKCNIVILEVGMGGEFDSTNIIKSPLVSVITPIGLDHMAYLGDTREKIAEAKAGIIKEDSIAVVSYENRDLCKVFESKCRETNSELIFSEPYKGRLKTALQGSYQKSNLSLVLSVIDVIKQKKLIKISADAIKNGLKKVTWPARFEYLSDKPALILDGAHNPHGIKGVTDSLKDIYGDKKIIYLTGMLGDKNIDGMLDILCDNARMFYTVRPESKRACEAEELSKRIVSRGHKCVTCENVPDAVEQAIRAASEDDVICCLGSLYLAGAIREYVLSR